MNKACLEDYQTKSQGCPEKWYKDTGGGSGLITFYEGWTNSKLENYNVDIDSYNHINYSSKPLILWDKKSEYLLSSRHDPLNIWRGELGLARSNEGKLKEILTGREANQKIQKKP